RAVDDVDGVVDDFTWPRRQLISGDGYIQEVGVAGGRVLRAGRRRQHQHENDDGSAHSHHFLNTGRHLGLSSTHLSSPVSSSTGQTLVLSGVMYGRLATSS